MIIERRLWDKREKRGAYRPLIFKIIWTESLVIVVDKALASGWRLMVAGPGTDLAGVSTQTCSLTHSPKANILSFHLFQIIRFLSTYNTTSCQRHSSGFASNYCPYPINGPDAVAYPSTPFWSFCGVLQTRRLSEQCKYSTA